MSLIPDLTKRTAHLGGAEADWICKDSLRTYGTAPGGQGPGCLTVLGERGVSSSPVLPGGVWFARPPDSPVGAEAAALKRRKCRLLTRLCIPADALPGSLVLSHRRCGKPGCHCAEGRAHPFYSLTFLVAGKKHVESIPAE
jgi:hypothetical protein